MSVIKFTDSTSPSEFSMAKKQYEYTYGHLVTNSEFLKVLLDGYLVTIGTPTEVSTSTPSDHSEVTIGTPSNHTKSNGMVTMDTLVHLLDERDLKLKAQSRADLLNVLRDYGIID